MGAMFGLVQDLLTVMTYDARMPSFCLAGEEYVNALQSLIGTTVRVPAFCSQILRPHASHSISGMSGKSRRGGRRDASAPRAGAQRRTGSSILSSLHQGTDPPRPVIVIRLRSV